MHAGTGLFPMLVDGQNALLAPPDDPERLAAAIRVMTDPDLRQRLATAPRELSHYFEWETLAQRHLAIYDR